VTLVVLIGPPGAGKSTVGRIVADRLGVAFVDTDALVEERSGSSISDLFVVHGEPHFRALEAAAVAGAITAADAVVALGGGAPMTPATDEALAALGERARIVFLDVGIADAAGRVGFDTSRPLLAVNPRSTWVRLMAQRRPTYERLADLVVDTAGRSPEAVAADLVAELGARS
jgi:shikimate kinase